MKSRQASPQVEECADDLRRLLADGPAPAATVSNRVNSLWSREVTAHARRRLGVVTTRVNGIAFYELPDDGTR
jgi:hypothetical protein